MCAGMTFTRTTSAQTSEQTNSRSALDQYAINLTTQALQRKFEAVENFEVEIERVISSLANSSTKAPLLISQSDADRSAIARGVALRIALGNAPENLRGKSVYSLSLDALAKGATSSHDFEQRLQSVLHALPERDRRCLFLRADGMRYREIAKALGISLGAVAKSLARSMSRLMIADRW